MEFIDTHAHLYDEAFEGQTDEVICRSIENGIDKIIFPDIDSKSRERMFEIAAQYPDNIFPCLGLHPTSVEAGWKAEMDLLEKEKAKERRIYAIGEIGIDCYWSKEFLKEQEEVFRIQLEWASQMDLPVIIHSRESTGLILNILNENKHLNLRGSFHAFSGSIETFNEILKTGEWYVGIGGVLTYKKASIAETVRSIPLDRILLETDSPYLTPVPFRGKRNESSYIKYIAGHLAAIKGCTLEDVASTTTQNAKNLFKL